MVILNMGVEAGRYSFTQVHGKSTSPYILNYFVLLFLNELTLNMLFRNLSNRHSLC